LMIVDDHRGVRELIRELAGILATDVREYATGEDALADCRHFQPDMVTLDLRMSGMDGLTTAEMIRSRVRDAYVVIVTQFDSAALREWAARRGVDKFVSKDQLTDLRPHFEAVRAGIAP
jgi:two-component system, NarL family, nitrate/nitrite response regulator NarP